jgi:hypothetical protein
MYQSRLVGVIYYGWSAKTMVFEDRLHGHRNKTLQLYAKTPCFSDFLAKAYFLKSRN